MDEVLDAGIVGDGKVQILTDTTVTFQRIDDKIRQNIILVDQSQDILEIGGADDDVNAQIFLAAGYYRMFDMFINRSSPGRRQISSSFMTCVTEPERQ